MSNWTIANVTDTGVTAGKPDTPVAVLTIVPASGYAVTPENFTIKGGTETYGGSNIWVYGRGFEGLVSSVTFAQSSTNVTCTAVYKQAVYNAAKTISLGITESLLKPVIGTSTTNTAAVILDYSYSANVGVTITKPSDVAQTNITSGSSSSNHVKKFSITQNGLKDYELVKLTIDPSSSYHLISNYGSIPNSNGFRTVSKKNSDGTWDFSVKYTEPTGSNYSSPTSLIKTPRALINYAVKADSTSTTKQVKRVTATQKIPNYGGGSEIVVTGDINSEYTIAIRNATTGYYYQWNGLWASGSATQAGNLGASGINYHSLPISASATTTLYNVVLAAVTGSTLGSGVPDAAGELQITQYGSNTLTIGLASVDTGDYGTLPDDITVVRPIRYDGDPYLSLVGTTINFTGKTRGSSKRLMIDRFFNGLQPGMYVVGTGIPHNTTVTGVGDGVLLLSVAVNISSTTSFKAVPSNADNVPYSFTVVPNSSSNDLEPNASNNHNTSIWGFNNVTTKCTQNEQAGSTSITVTNANGILRNMTATGGQLGANIVVTAVNYKTNVVTTNSHGAISNTNAVYFKGANNPKVKSTHIAATQSGVNVVVSGYIHAPVVDNTANVEIFIDDIINAT